MQCSGTTQQTTEVNDEREEKDVNENYVVLFVHVIW